MIGASVHLVGSDAARYLDSTPEGERQRAVRVLDAESTSLARLGAGALAWAAAVLGSGLTAALAWDGLHLGLRSIAFLAGVVVLAWASWFGHRVWRAGRSVISTYARLLAAGDVPGPDEAPSGRGADIVRTRVFVLGSGPRMLRLVIAVCAGLTALILWMTFGLGSSQPVDPVSAVDGQRAALAIFGALAGTASAVSAVAAFGGVHRANAAQAQHDPIWRWLRGKLLGAAPTAAGASETGSRARSAGRMVAGTAATVLGLVAALLIAGSADPSNASGTALAVAGTAFGLLASVIGGVVWWRGRTAISAHLQAVTSDSASPLPSPASRVVAAVVCGLVLLVLLALLVATVAGAAAFATDEAWPVVWLALSLATITVTLCVLVGGLVRARGRR